MGQEKTLVSIDKQTKKFLVDVGDTYVETTYVDYLNKHIICFSSMAGCPVGCKFCVSGQNNAYRILTTNEMVKQCNQALRNRSLHNKPILFSCMGEGEPFLNFRNVMDALKQLGAQHPNSKLAVSTSGVKPHLLKHLAREEFPVPFKLQISLHSPYPLVRRKIMPHAGELNLIQEYLPYYLESGKDLEFNYVLLDGVNDQKSDAIRLAEIAHGTTIKLNMLNPIPNCEYTFSKNFKEFCKTLKDFGANYEFYKTNGSDINAACGQLSHQYK